MTHLHHLILGIGPTERFGIIVGILATIIGILGAIVKAVWTGAQLVTQQLDATRENTRAINELASRMNKLENGHRK